MLFSERVVKEKRDREKIFHLQFGYQSIGFPERKEKLYKVGVQGFGQVSMILLMNIRIKKLGHYCVGSSNPLSYNIL